MSTSLVASLSLRLDLGEQAAVPLFRQLYGGTRLPPTRQLAMELQVARKTVVGAFEQLIAEGYLEGKVGSGTYVAQVLPEEMLQVNRAEAAGVSSTPSQARMSRLSNWGASLASRASSSVSGD